ncbi:hypothetical protein M1403_00810 [Patescibacteria group bacterium]|nr:hypothetical protein [Patescibacteria group bacterium]
MKKILIGVASAAIGLAMFAVPAFAAPSVHTNFGQTVNASSCNTSSAPVVNVTYKVTNNADSGVVPPVWATDNYTKRLQIWQQANGTFCAIAKYQGQFVTNGAGSPETGETLAAGVQGAFEGGYTAFFDGTLNSSPSYPTHGNIGTFDFSSGPSFDWIGTYFTGYTDFKLPYWAWNYHAGNNGSWVNASTGNHGDITGN